MNTFVAILFVILGLAFVIFFVYEIICLVRDVKKHIKKKKEAKTDSENTNKQ